MKASRRDLSSATFGETLKSMATPAVSLEEGRHTPNRAKPLQCFPPKRAAVLACPPSTTLSEMMRLEPAHGKRWPREDRRRRRAPQHRHARPAVLAGAAPSRISAAARGREIPGGTIQSDLSAPPPPRAPWSAA